MTKIRLAFAILITTIIIPFGASMVQAAVSLESYTGSWTGNTVTLEFATGSEIEHAAFHVWRSSTDINPNQVSNTTATRLTTSPIRGDSACTSGSGDYEFVDDQLGSGTTYFYFLESISCGSGTEFYGAIDDEDSGLRLTNGSTPPSATPSNTPPAGATNTPTSTTAPGQPTNTPTRQPTTAPGQPTNTPGPTGTLIPLATDVPPSATPRPTNTLAPNAPTSTTAPQPTQATQNTPPTEAPVQPTEAPPPTVANVEVTPQTGSETQTETTPPTETPPVIAAAVSPVATDVAPGGEMSSGGPAATPTLAGGDLTASESGGTGLNGTPDTETLVESSAEGDGLDGLIQGLIAVILVGVVGLGGFIGWNYMRNR